MLYTEGAPFQHRNPFNDPSIPNLQFLIYLQKGSSRMLLRTSSIMSSCFCAAVCAAARAPMPHAVQKCFEIINDTP